MARVVTCHNMQGIRMADCNLNNCPDVQDSFCVEKGLTKPPASSPCNQQSCFNAMWWSQDWGDCSQVCGAGNQTRVVDCVSTGTFNKVDESQCGGSKPSRMQSCNTHKCSEYQWVPGSWATCSSVCGGGTRTRSVNTMHAARRLSAPRDCELIVAALSTVYTLFRTLTCIFGGAKVDNDQCTSNGVVMPETTGACNTQACATFWWTSDFGDCSKECEYGVAERRVKCRSSTTAQGVLVPDSQCTSTKPAETAVCNVHPCPAWVTSDWSTCSVRCGDGGVRTRTVICLSFDNTVVDNSKCVHNMPMVSEPCGIETSGVGLYAPESSTLHRPCPHWHRSDWTDCSRPCGAGYQNRTLTCRMPHDNVWQGRVAEDETLCPAGYAGSDAGPLITTGSELNSPGSFEDHSIPALSQQCNTNPCRDYYWHAEWSACSVNCAGGVRLSTVSCVRSRDDTVVSGNLCLDIPPPSSRPCNTQACASYEWFNLTDWGSCSVQCGSGVQRREIRCRDRTPHPSLMIAWELVSNTKCEDAGLTKLDGERPCSFPYAQCHGMDPAPRSLLPITPGLQRVNGKCIDGRCVCRPGYGPGGTNCHTRPAISRVVLNGLQYNQQGIPFGESIQLTWLSSAHIPFVSILLVNDRLTALSSIIPFPQLIVERMLNNGSLIWRVGSGLAIGIGDGGSGFKLRVRFDSETFADSETELTLANPCGYVSCGKQGRCVTNGVCQCNPGWSGKQCELNPCDDRKCNLDHSTCQVGTAAAANLTATPVGSNALGEDVAYCKCKDGWSGSRCATPPGCTASCANGGDFVVSGIITTENNDVLTCPTQCGCTRSWDTATSCATCALTCQHEGQPDDSCSRCICATDSGYFGTQCQCNYYVMTIKFKFDVELMPAVSDVAAWSSSSAVLGLISNTLTRDFAQALGLDASYLLVRVAAVNSTGIEIGEVILDVHFSKACQERAFEVLGVGTWYNQHSSTVILDESAPDFSAGSAAYVELHKMTQEHHDDKTSSATHRRLLQSATGAPAPTYNVSSYVTATPSQFATHA
jgi:hypothetical protein